MKKLIGIAALAIGATLLLPVPANASVTFDPAAGTGFVGKGDVQLAFGGWSNAQLQTRADAVGFGTLKQTVTVTEVSWECTNDRNEKIQERERTTTTSSTTTGVVDAVARDGKKQVTGFNLNGYTSESTLTSATVDGPPKNSCPTGWTLSTPAGDPAVVTESHTGTLNVTYAGDTRLLTSF